MELKPGTIISDKYSIKKQIASRQITQVFLALNNIKNYDVILKVLNFSRINNWDAYEFYEKEIKLLKNLDHTYIPSYIDNFEFEYDGEKLYILARQYI